VDSATLAEGLRLVMRPAVGGDVSIEDLTRVPGGASRETWSFVARGPSGAMRRLILRRDPPGAPSSGLHLEAALLQAAGRTGVPVPTVVTSGDDRAGLGSAFIVMDFVEGETIPRRILRQPEYAAARGVLAEQCGRTLAALHRIPAGDVPGLAGGDPLEGLRAVLDRLGQPHPAFELAFRQLGSTRPPRAGEVVVHGDFRNGNLIVGQDGLRAVLDWELAHVGDPFEDLGWLCVKAWRFGHDLPVGGFGTIDQLLGAYVDAGGPPVDRDTLAWWTALGTLRWGIICIVQALTHTSGAVRSVELAAIGRRVCEVEWDLLEILS
jgi:aminoglycoside phosphotransferase (APT) family kinase protein